MKKIFSFLLCSVMALAASATTFTKVTTAPEDWSGQYIVVYEDSAGIAKIFKGEDAALNSVTDTVVNDTIISDILGSYVVTIAPMEGGYSLSVLNQYMGGVKDQNKISFSANPILNTIELDSAGVKIESNTSVLRYFPGGGATGQRFRYYKAATYAVQKPVQLYRADGEIAPPSVDTISVTEARARISAGNLIPCYVKGVVATNPSDPGTYGNTIFWMTDIDNPTDSLEGYKIFGLNGDTIPTKADIPVSFGDTVLIYANALMLYNSSIYEINGGYVAEILGASPYEILSFQYADVRFMGAENNVATWVFTLSTQEDVLPGVTFLVTNDMLHGIAGRYSAVEEGAYLLTEDSVQMMTSCSFNVFYAGQGADYNLYTIYLNFATAEGLYYYTAQLEIAAYNSDYTEPYSLSDDQPYIPQAGDTLTCAQAKEYTLTLASGTTTEFEVTVIGYVTDNLGGNVSKGQQSFWLDDVKDSGEKTFQGYWCNIPDKTTAVPVGAKLAITGKLTNYGGTTAEMKNGNITYIEGEPTPEERELNILPVPDDAITVAEALAIGNALDSISEESYTVVGYIAKVQYQTTNDSATWYMADEKVDGSGHYDFEAYKCAIDNLILVGDFVFVTGQITKYVGSYTTIEIKYGEAHFAEAPSAIENVTAQPAALDLSAPMYNTLGQPVDATFRGIVIQNGHKYLLY